MEKLINRVGLSWLYDHIKEDVSLIIKSLNQFSLDDDTFRQIDGRLSHLAKVFYALNISAGVFFINEFRLTIISLKKLKSHQEQEYKIKYNVISNNINQIESYIEDIIQGYGDLLIYYVFVIDELRAVRSEILFSQCSYIVNSVQQHNISAYPTNYSKNQRNNINKALSIIQELYDKKQDSDKILANVNIIKNELKGTAHYLLWELIYAYILLEKNYNLKSTYVIDLILPEILSSYSNSLFDQMGFEKLAQLVANWIGTFCFNLIYCDGFSILPQATKDKILKILVIHERQSLTNYMAFAERMQETDGWILILDISSELDLALSRLQDCKRKKRMDLSWLLELLQKHIDSCILTGTYAPIEFYYNAVQLISKNVISTRYLDGQNIDIIEEVMLTLIKNIEAAINNFSDGVDFITDEPVQEILSDNGSIATVNAEAKRILLKEQLNHINQILHSLEGKKEVQLVYVKESLHKIVNIFNILGVEAAMSIVNQYINKINIVEDNSVINLSVKQNTIIFIKYLQEIVRAVHNQRDFVFYIKAAKKLIEFLPVAALDTNCAKSDNNMVVQEIKEEPDVLFHQQVQTTPDLKEIFFDEAQDIIENIYVILDKTNKFPDHQELINSFARELHTLKGASRMVGFSRLSDWTHHLEELCEECLTKIEKISAQHINVLRAGVGTLNSMISSYKSNITPEIPIKLNFNYNSNESLNDTQISIASILKENQAEKSNVTNTNAINHTIPTRQTVRIANNELDDLLDVVCELIIGQHQLSEQLNYYRILSDKLKHANSAEKITELTKSIQDINKAHASVIKTSESNIAGVFERLINLRLMPINAIKSRLENLVITIANELNKKISLNLNKLEGNIDRVVLEQITPILDHLIRNAIDHGIESENIRRKFNKNVIGRLDLSIYTEDKAVIIELSDDGAGIDAQKIAERAVRMNLIQNVQPLSNDQIISIITTPGFTTAELTQISGRGIGMDVVKNIVNQLCGVIKLETKKHHGTKFSLKIPYSLAKQSLLFVKICDLTYAIPVLIIDEVINVAKSDLKTTSDFHVLYKDIEVYNMFDLINMDKKEYQVCFSNNNKSENNFNIVVVNYNSTKLGFIVDEIYETRDAVIRSLPAQMRQINEYMGGTIYKDGRVVLILDLITILNNFKKKHVNTSNKSYEEVEASLEETLNNSISSNILVVEDSATMRHAIEQYLDGTKYNLITAVDGVDGIKKIMLFNPDLILLDIVMPNMNGLDFLKYIRQQEKFKRTPVIIMTSRDDESYREQAMKLNVDVYLKKPYDKSKLVKAIEHVLD